MGTEARIVFYAPDSTVARTAAAAAFERIAEIDRRLSDYRLDSEVATIAAARGGDAVPVSDDMIFVLSRALVVAAETDGAYDPTVGAVTALWRDARQKGTLPAEEATRAALARTGWRNVAIDMAARTVRPALSGIRLDLGGIAKGWAADEALETLAAHSVTRALIDFGGEVVTSAPPPGRTGWRVSLDNRIPGDTVDLAHGAISASGPAEQFIEIDGVRYSHVVDPRTGAGLSDGRAATVRARQGWLADVLATAATLVDSAGLDRLRSAYAAATIEVSPAGRQ